MYVFTFIRFLLKVYWFFTELKATVIILINKRVFFLGVFSEFKEFYNRHIDTGSGKKTCNKGIFYNKIFFYRALVMFIN